GRPRYGIIGLVALPGFFLFEMLSPVIEFSGYIVLPLLLLLGYVPISFASPLLVLSVLYSILVSVLAVLLEDITFRRYPKASDMAVLVGAAVLENLGYRQLTVWWRVRAFWEYWRGDLSWGAMERRGVGAA
ncbi:MAG TPA: hypothetical protein VNC19_00655, partial [Gemmatimonadales bacterium]|nr:hypothetical protein [Gemmatimonadales bacterium]